MAAALPNKECRTCLLGHDAKNCVCGRGARCKGAGGIEIVIVGSKRSSRGGEGASCVACGACTAANEAALAVRGELCLLRRPAQAGATTWRHPPCLLCAALVWHRATRSGNSLHRTRSLGGSQSSGSQGSSKCILERGGRLASPPKRPQGRNSVHCFERCCDRHPRSGRSNDGRAAPSPR